MVFGLKQYGILVIYIKKVDGVDQTCFFRNFSFCFCCFVLKYDFTRQNARVQLVYFGDTDRTLLLKKTLVVVYLALN